MVQEEDIREETPGAYCKDPHYILTRKDLEGLYSCLRVDRKNHKCISKLTYMLHIFDLESLKTNLGSTLQLWIAMSVDISFLKLNIRDFIF